VRFFLVLFFDFHWIRPQFFCRETIIVHKGWIKKVIVNEEGDKIASCSLDQVRLWFFLFLMGTLDSYCVRFEKKNNNCSF